MSSEEDDLEEEELLQMALKEQAERDLNYNRPIPKQVKPPAKLAPPPMPAAKRQQQRQQQQQQAPKGRPPVEEEEESEVELLSISSEDEDAPLGGGGGGSGGSSRFIGRRGGGGSGSRSNYSDHATWDADEPNSWKRVDEAELARRVREMREARAAPAGQSRTRKSVSLPRKPMVALDSLTRGGGSDLVDPLGIGVIDLKSLTLVNDSAESSPAASKTKNTNEKLRKDNITTSPSDQEIPTPRDPSLREKVMYHSENFDARYFLSRIHQNTSAADLEAGALALKTDLRDRTQQRKQLVKENFDCFVSCKTTIDDIQLKLKQIESDPEGAGTVHLKYAVEDVGSVANRAFGPLFERQVQVEKIRSVQGTLQRFRTLFNLPSAIRANINKGEYDLAVREYRKAKSIVLPSHVGILKRVLEEVEKVVQEFKATLYKSMEDPQVELSNLENTIRLLLELEPKSDPIWHYLNIQNRRIRGLLEACTFDHEARMDAFHTQIRERMQSDARWKQIQQESNKSSSVDYSLLLGDNEMRGEPHLRESSGEEADALRGRLIRRLTAVIVHHVPTFWRLALSIFSGKFAKVSQVGSTNGVLESSKYKGSTGKQNSSEIKYSNHSMDEVVGMVDDIISVYDTKAQNTFQEFEESNVLRPYMREAIKEISKACTAFEGKDCAPITAVQTIFALRTEVTKVLILRLCSWMKATTLDIVNDECWVPVSVLERNGSAFAISASPLSFHEMMLSAMDQISEMVESLKQNSSEAYDMDMQVQQMQDSVRFTFLNCFLEFTGSLEKIAAELPQIKTRNDSTASQNGYSQVFSDKFAGLQPGIEITNPHQKLLMVLSNIGFCKNELLPELSNKYKMIWTDSSLNGTNAGTNEDLDADVVDLIASLSGLEEKVLSQYNYAKVSLIGTAATAYLLEDGVQWGGAPTVKGVRDAAVELLHPLVAVHAEVHSGAKPFLENTISILVEGLMDTLLGVFGENRTKALKFLDVNGYCQLMLELDYFETILHTYLTPAALKSLRDLLLEKASETVIESSDNVGHNRRATRGGGSEDGITGDERQQVSPDDLITMAHQISADYLQLELRRTQMNTVCFREVSVQLEPYPNKGRNAYQAFQTLAAPGAHSKGAESMGASGYSRHRRKLSGSSLSDSESSKPLAAIHPSATFNQPGYSSSDVGSETGSLDVKGRGPLNERYSRNKSEMKWNSRRTARVIDDDLR
ncbi:hypothetical protein SUGI_1176620 [Cryptomeria japonica]|uniref:exocyst complex component SEC5B n=1 Tax=Cryptomeria japonica TaxID=3369 RepID=UPI0024146C96|nr:exocyst complex component SEC5B [Cryptomeria japonica]GLJ54776.1 hypothetical protein SUGI_1176620 [Cryptomeria japonica]